MRVKLTVKLASVMEGVDLSPYQERDVIELSERDASLLIRGGWAEPASKRRVRCTPRHHSGVAMERAS